MKYKKLGHIKKAEGTGIEPAIAGIAAYLRF